MADEYIIKSLKERIKEIKVELEFKVTTHVGATAKGAAFALRGECPVGPAMHVVVARALRGL
jgi:hypothetical protein